MHFVNDVVKPWDELNRLLALPFAYQPELSDVTRLANSVAVALKHTAEHAGHGRAATDNASPANGLISDVADGWKHGGKQLKDPARHNEIYVTSRFEVNAVGDFRFLRNRVVIQHATAGQIDFMTTARDAIRHWLQKLGLSITWTGAILEGPIQFENDAKLYYDARQQLGMSSVRLETVRRDSQGLLVLCDIADIRFVLLDANSAALQALGAAVAGVD